MISILNLKKYVVFLLTPKTFKPFYNTSGMVTLETITLDNVDDTAERFPEARVAVFKEKLRRNDVGVFARYEGKVMGYQWRKDYDTDKRVKADGYVPLSGKFFHLHWARVAEEMRGRALMAMMHTFLIRDAFARGIERIYTDVRQKNRPAIKACVKMGYFESFRLLVIQAKSGHNLCIKYKIKKH